MIDQVHRVFIKNALAIATCDDRFTRIRNGSIYIEGNVIKDIGSALNYQADEIIDASGKVIFPGLVNTHHHLYQTLTRNLPAVQDAELFEWLIK